MSGEESGDEWRRYADEHSSVVLDYLLQRRDTMLKLTTDQTESDDEWRRYADEHPSVVLDYLLQRRDKMIKLTTDKTAKDEEEPKSETSSRKNGNMAGPFPNNLSNAKSETVTNEPGKSSYNGLAVICVHGSFKEESYNRKSAEIDKNMMVDIWESYGFKTETFVDKDYDFYDKDIFSKIQEILSQLGAIKSFVFVLSTHGTNIVEKCIDHTNTGLSSEKQIKHYFSTYDKLFETQILMDNIAGEIEKHNKTGDILKMFVIQACRSMTSKSNKPNEDRGEEVYTESNDTGNMHADDTLNEGNQIASDGTMIDAKGSTNLNSSSSLSTSTHRIESQQFKNDDQVTSQLSKEQSNDPDNKETEHTAIEITPLCNNGIVMFASMSGKFAYRSEGGDEGGWLIRSLYKTLDTFQVGVSVDIFDVLSTVNNEVSGRQGTSSPPTSEDWPEETKKKMEILLLEPEKHFSELQMLAEYWIPEKVLGQFKEQMDINKLFDQYKNAIDKFIDFIYNESKSFPYKSQSCFSHNLVLQEDKLFLVRKSLVKN